MKTKHIFIVGFMLFAMFFGAGNLIFPPALGFSSGEYFPLAILGFVITGVGLPLIGVIVGAISKEGYSESLKNISPWFSVVFLVAIFLTIGPFFAIPRTATTAYEMGILPFIEGPGTVSLVIFSVVYFLIVFFLSIKPGNIIDSVGKILTPLLLVTMLLLIVVGIVAYNSNPSNPVVEGFNSASPFSTGFTEGYLTMDAIAAIVFSVVVLNSIRGLGITNRRDLLFGTMKSAGLAALLLGVIYVALGVLGNKVDIGNSVIGDREVGTFLLTFIANDTLGGFGGYLLGIIVFLACITTGVGLIVAVSEHFSKLIPKVNYGTWVFIFTFVSLVLANQGLSTIIKGSVPVLLVLYPIAMTVLTLLIVTYFVRSPKLALQLPVYVVSIVSILTVIERNGFFGGSALSFLQNLPLYESQFEWIPIMIIGFVLGYIIGLKGEKVTYT
ncbi:branched-chain amino acid transport system II carrier protein [Phocicoccus pinnipedialis]|uniref:Branched-chain amino acid transport system carrier protein n=1 Tax=Phocicoccus pinnipedialis TaxID=110845 RepID=A0A6V7REP2_9BACL|nr:branched-chain amino acid transport system II carrier protein [Jeotgalicoccus pinnipedialis]MBP1939417.1 LIVCS family branched-chain amino acid:cation transporter [Jeotgalicoccus pinnipedialis]CAD2075469.1 Branched-chain amino acid transport system 2 carrier protein [Jeotgalicoccus pinnipedialis]